MLLGIPLALRMCTHKWGYPNTMAIADVRRYRNATNARIYLESPNIKITSGLSAKTCIFARFCPSKESIFMLYSNLSALACVSSAAAFASTSWASTCSLEYPVKKTDEHYWASRERTNHPTTASRTRTSRRANMKTAGKNILPYPGKQGVSQEGAERPIPAANRTTGQNIDFDRKTG